MSWYDPTSWGSTGKNILNALVPGSAWVPSLQGSVAQNFLGDPGADAEKSRKALLYEQAADAGNFADRQQSTFRASQGMARNNITALQGLASGQNSVAAEQLRQGLQQNLAAQRSIAASAAPQDAAGAARTAAIQSGRLGAGLAGQQAIAGLQERNQAQAALSNAIGTYSGQALQATQGARGQALQGYGAQNAGAPEKSWIEKYGPSIVGGAGLAASDRKLKTDISDGDEQASKMLGALKAYMFSYKDEGKFGKGKRLGIMAQDLEAAGLGHAVEDTPAGKMVNGAQLATSNTAMIAALNKRLEKIESAA